MAITRWDQPQNAYTYNLSLRLCVALYIFLRQIENLIERQRHSSMQIPVTSQFCLLFLFVFVSGWVTVSSTPPVTTLFQLRVEDYFLLSEEFNVVP